MFSAGMTEGLGSSERALIVGIIRWKSRIWGHHTSFFLTGNSYTSARWQTKMVSTRLQIVKLADPFVAIHKRVVLDQEAQQICSFFFDAGIDLLAVEGLHARAERPFQAVVSFQAEEV